MWVVLALCLLSLFHCTQGAPTTIPFYTGPPLSVDSGYISVGNIRLFYLHVESEKNPSTDPVVFWFQGGPGGSSMIGAFLENGPWSVESTSSVEYKDLNWIKAGANMVYLDQPACVGFSYSTNMADCNSSDTKSAAVNVQAIRTFLHEIMPQYKTRAFWYSGESYAGAYVPMLSALTVDDPLLRTNFAGFMVGNPVMECYNEKDPQSFGVGDTWSYFNQLYWNGYVDQQDYEDWRQRDCDSESHRHGVPHPQCDDILNRAQAPNLLGDDFDADDNFNDYCSGNGTLSFALSECENDAKTRWNVMDDYLELPQVMTSFHAHQIYNSKQRYFQYIADAKGGMNQYYQKVLATKPSVHILIYSGLSDVYTVPFSYTMPCVHALALMEKSKVNVPWTVWKVNEHHSAGHWKRWDNNVTYATVKGAGHEVPMYQPFLAYQMFDRFLHTYGLADPKP